ncbi:MAG: transcriptional regulator [Confluentimicrobium sp.]|jgi:transcriptional regulator with XRE-family HTH domain|uniref:helix-turn-helix domain-containing protein n=1 Tax=Actibacterium sp. TaxID=1872125 RepID=UPI000C61A231|nr:helix-turn-helix transcriptional regulator [Actibacterium sp.]MBC55643.1 transcriptional regulator [Actibacterium sp.]|tara:strand:- start:10148 stop:10699 length:552 start_codon:yes stop_codon:yes gene_type:complete
MTVLHDDPFPYFGPRLRRLRRAVGLKQSALADMLNVDQATVSRWESGRQTPAAEVQLRAWKVLGSTRSDDPALCRLVETSQSCVHLVEEATHCCLAYSAARARDWQRSQRELVGVSLWQFATDEIRRAEADLADSDWWSVQMPAPRIFQTSERRDAIRISAGGIMWERLYLSDGTPVRLVTGV